MRVRILPLLSGLFLILASPFAGIAQTNGIFADFETSLGNFSCSLDFSNAPMTVANFIGLAEGERNWLNDSTGKVERRPMFDQTLFHRVATNFVIQSGSPDGTPTGGPGYTFPDEVSTNALHDAAGVLSMGNSGLNSNGSQFFVTLTDTAELNFFHSVFGRVTSGMNVVQAIGAVPVDANERPLTDVVLGQVRIRRVGAAADSFDIHSQGLPEVQPVATELLRSGSGLELQLTRERDHEYWQYISFGLSNWVEKRIGLYIDDPSPGNVVIDPGLLVLPWLRVLVCDIDYPGPLFTPEAVAGHDLVLQLNSSYFLVIELDADGGGAYRVTTIEGPPLEADSFSSSVWSQQAYRGILWIPDTLSPLMKIHFVYGGADSGYFRGEYDGATIFGPFLLIAP